MNTEDRFRILGAIELYGSISFYGDSQYDDHEGRSSVLGAQLAGEMHLPKDFIEVLKYCFDMHDVGKAVIDEKTRNKPKLNASEINMVRGHAMYGAKIIERLNIDTFLKKIISGAIKHHHEDWDGRGYPCRLQREEIPIEARIIRVVDSYDAMTHDRPYRKAFTHGRTMIEMERRIGLAYDPTILNVFKRMVASG
jgi:HD-GYP domain-containing protein (c-di-GMP phosphodiesterase class II)